MTAADHPCPHLCDDCVARIAARVLEAITSRPDVAVTTSIRAVADTVRAHTASIEDAARRVNQL